LVGRKGGATAESIIAEFNVDEVIEGEPADDSKVRIDIELFKPSLVDVGDLADAVPKQPVLVLLQEASQELMGVKIDESGAERDPDKTLYLPPTTKAIFIKLEGDVVTPLDMTPGPFEKSIGATSLEELADEIRSF